MWKELNSGLYDIEQSLCSYRLEPGVQDLINGSKCFRPNYFVLVEMKRLGTLSMLLEQVLECLVVRDLGLVLV